MDTTANPSLDHMSMAEAVVAILMEKPGSIMTARDLARELLARRPEAYRLKRARSTQAFAGDEQFLQQIVSEVGAQKAAIQKRCAQVRTTTTRPRGYVYVQGDDGTIADIPDALPPPQPEGTGQDAANKDKQRRRNLTEHDLYPLLSRYLLDEHDIRTKRIDEKRSSNRRGNGGNKWLHPDIVGVETAWSGWNPAVRECAKTLADLQARQWSFEVKKAVHLGNVREVYFQAVSNSSWANYGYLVAANVDEAVMGELRMLFSAHGVGLIVLDIDNPSESEIVIPARERREIDWVQVNRLAEENRDFMDYVNLVRQFHLIGEVKNEDWDARPAAEID